MKRNIWSIVAVLFVIAVASASALTLSSSGSNYDNLNRNTVNDNTRVSSCDINPDDSVDTCDHGPSTMMNTQTVSDTWTDNTHVTVSDTSASQWVTLRCRAGDNTNTVSDTSVSTIRSGSVNTADTGRTNSMYGRTTAYNASNGSSSNNYFDRSNTADNSGSYSNTQTWNNRNTVSDADMQSLQCYVVEGSSDSWNVDRVSDKGASTTRGFESPVIYSGTLNTQRTADGVDANDAVPEDTASSTNTGSVGTTD